EGAGSIVFTLTKAGATDLPSEVSYVTASGTATAAEDFVATVGNVVFAPSETTTVISINLIDDSVDEEDQETFTITLSNPVEATLQTTQVVGTITDNDNAPSLSIAAAAASEGAGEIVFTVTKSG